MSFSPFDTSSGYVEPLTRLTVYRLLPSRKHTCRYRSARTYGKYLPSRYSNRYSHSATFSVQGGLFRSTTPPSLGKIRRISKRGRYTNFTITDWTRGQNVNLNYRSFFVIKVECACDRRMGRWKAPSFLSGSVCYGSVIDPPIKNMDVLLLGHRLGRHQFGGGVRKRAHRLVVARLVCDIRCPGTS